MKAVNRLLLTATLLCAAGADRVWTPEFPVSRTPKKFSFEVKTVDHHGAPVSVVPAWFGTPPQALHLAFYWNENECEVVGDNWRHLPYYDHARSSTYKPNGTEVSSFVVNGVTSRDRLALGPNADGVVVDDMLFVEVKGGSYHGIPEYQGSCGLGFGDGEATGTPSFMRTLIQQGRVERPLVGVSFDPSRSVSSVTVGGVDETKLKGPIEFVDVIQDDLQSWRLPLHEIRVGDQAIPISTNQTAFIGGDFSCIAGPDDQISVIADALGADTFVLPCNASLPDITIQVGGVKLVLTKDQYLRQVDEICTLRFCVMSAPADWYISMGMLPQVYTVLAYGETRGHERVGFAAAHSAIA